MKVLLDAVTLFTIGLLLAAIATLALRWPFANMAEGQLLCESDGAVLVRIAGHDYAVNGLASRWYPPIQSVWNKENFPDTNLDRIIVRGLTLCDGSQEINWTVAYWIARRQYGRLYRLGRS